MFLINRGQWYICASVYQGSASVPNHDVIKWKQFPPYWLFVRGIHRSPVNSPHKGKWRGALMFSLIAVWINDWVNNREAGDLRRYRAHYVVPVMRQFMHCSWAMNLCFEYVAFVSRFVANEIRIYRAPSLTISFCIHKHFIYIKFNSIL